MDPEVGLLDLTASLVRMDGVALDFLQIVAVKPSEGAKYRASGPFFVVMELPREQSFAHSTYGSLLPEKLGIGCARHYLMRLANALTMQHIFMLDDSVQHWRGVTLVNDAHNMFGKKAGKKAQFTKVP